MQIRSNKMKHIFALLKLNSRIKKICPCLKTFNSPNFQLTIIILQNINPFILNKFKEEHFRLVTSLNDAFKNKTMPL